MSWLQSKPPLVTFFVALFCFATTFFVLALVVNSREQLVNPDILSWNVFFAKISKLDFCVHNRNSSSSNNSSRRKRDADAVAVETTLVPTEDDGSNNNATTVSDDLDEILRANITVSVPFTAQFVRSIHDLVSRNSLMPPGSEEPILTSGAVQLGHLEQASFGKYQDMRLAMSFLLPAPKPAGDTSDQDVCVMLEAPQELLDDLNSGQHPKSCDISPIGVVTKVPFETHTRNHLPDLWCANGSVVDLVYEDQPTWTVYVSEEDRTLIHYHLMAMSGFLFALTGLGVVLAFLKCIGTSKKAARKTVGDRRGDMELLAQDLYED